MDESKKILAEKVTVVTLVAVVLMLLAVIFLQLHFARDQVAKAEIRMECFIVMVAHLPSPGERDADEQLQLYQRCLETFGEDPDEFMDDGALERWRNGP